MQQRFHITNFGAIVAHDIIVKKRMARSAAFLDIAEKLGLGIAARDRIATSEVKPG